MFLHYFGRDQDFTNMYRHAQDNPPPGCLYFEATIPSKYPVLKGVCDINYFTDILNSHCPVVRNPTPLLDIQDIVGPFNDAAARFPLSKEAASLGGGVTVCMSQGTASLIHEEGYDMLQTDDHICSTNVDNPTNEVHQSFQDLKILFHDTWDLVEGDVDLVKAFTNDLKQSQLNILSMLAAKAPELSGTNTGGIVSSNLVTEKLQVRKQKKGVCG